MGLFKDLKQPKNNEPSVISINIDARYAFKTDIELFN